MRSANPILHLAPRAWPLREATVAVRRDDVGAVLLQNVSWIIYVFGGILIVTALKMAWMSSTNIDPEKNLVVILVRRLFPITRDFQGDRFFVRMADAQGKSKFFGTPLLLALVKDTL